MTEPDEALLWARRRARKHTKPALWDQIRAGHLDQTRGIPEMTWGYRAGVAASAERIKALEAALREVADDLEAEIKARAGDDLPRRVERDLEPVFRARALLKEPDQ